MACCTNINRRFEGLDYYPVISPRGYITGSEENNPLPINFCPWCGTKFVPAPLHADEEQAEYQREQEEEYARIVEGQQ